MYQYLIAVSFNQIGFQHVEIQRLHTGSGTAFHLWHSFEDSSAEWLRETSVRNAQVALHKLYDAFWEAELFGAVQHVLFGQFVLDHKLGEISDGFAGRRHFDDVAEELIGLPLRPFDGLELVAQS